MQLPARYLLFLGQQLSYKRLDVALDALNELLVTHDDVHLVLAGPTSPGTRRAIADRGLLDRVIQLGVVDEPTKAALLQRAAALVFPSEQEAFGGVLVEAAALGTPFVARSLPQLREVADRLGSGTFFTGGARELAVATRDLLDHPPTPADREATSIAAQLLSWPSLAAIYLDLYDRLAGSATPHSSS